MAQKSEIEAILIAGPTASGKSDAAMAVAERFGGVIINTDSLQVYDGLRVLTARPSDENIEKVPHDLYGFVEPSVRFSAGLYAEAAAHALEQAKNIGQLPVFVGGTGLYFSVLTEGLSPIPGVPPSIRDKVRGRLEATSVEALWQEVLRCDPVAAERIGPNDAQRLLRALEVFEATGEPLTSWQARPRTPLLRGRHLGVVLMPDRAWLYERINRRFDEMINEGALDEVRALQALTLAPDVPAMKALGVAELGAYLKGEISLEEAKTSAKMGSRRYAKRQMTWFRNQMIAWNVISEQQSDRKIDELFALICDSGLTP